MFVRTLGHTRVLRDGAEVQGAWLEQLPGQLLKLLVTFRGQMVPVERIAEALWPGGGASVLASVRFTVHQLRKRIDVADAGPSLVVSHRGGYRLDGVRTRCDADVFAELVACGLAAAAAGVDDEARADLEAAISLYRGDYVDDEPYAEWLFPERERLRELAGRALSALAGLCERVGDLDGAARHLERLTRLEPYDEDVQRLLIETCLRRGRRSEAMRRYAMLEGLLRRDLGARPSFALRDLLAAQLDACAPHPVGGPASAGHVTGSGTPRAGVEPPFQPPRESLVAVAR
jgi:DNA-binding SARP family transcriptional activator